MSDYEATAYLSLEKLKVKIQLIKNLFLVGKAYA
jgi:hypothetical protein